MTANTVSANRRYLALIDARDEARASQRQAESELERCNIDFLKMAEWKVEQMHRADKAEAELKALRLAVEDFLTWQNGVPLLNYDPPYQPEGHGYTASLKRLEALLTESRIGGLFA